MRPPWLAHQGQHSGEGGVVPPTVPVQSLLPVLVILKLPTSVSVPFGVATSCTQSFIETALPEMVHALADNV